MKKRLILPVLFLIAAPGAAVSEEKKTEKAAPVPKCEKCEAHAAGKITGSLTVEPADVKIPDLVLLDQNGKEVRVLEDLIEGKTVAVNFIFTTCKTICPPMGANFAKVSQLIEESKNENLSMISVSLDPAVDSPERLKAWSEQFGGGGRWTLLTGSKHDVDSLLKGMNAFTANKSDHAPFMLVGNHSKKQWIRLNGFESPEKVCAKLLQIDGAQAAKISAAADPAGTASAESEAKAAAREYFTDTLLTDQHGKQRKFYTDLVEGKTVIMHSFFSECKGACPIILEEVAKVRERFADRLGKDLHILSISVDPETDTSEELKSYAEGFDAAEGWYFLTGSKQEVDRVLGQIGHFTENREAHSNFVIIGNEKTGLWKKAFGLDQRLDLPQVVDEVLRDQG